MAITKEDIINQIPTFIKTESRDIVLTLRSLVARGWGTECELYKKLSTLWDEIHSSDNGESIVLGEFDRDTFIISEFYCMTCYDSGTTLDDNFKDIPCSCVRGKQL